MTFDKLLRNIITKLNLAVRFDSQSLSEEQKNQARENIGAMSAEYVSQELDKIKEELSNNIGQLGGSADYAQNDPDAPGYIKNRTHWVDDPTASVVKTIFEEQTLDFSGGPVSNSPASFMIESGKTYLVTYNETEYICSSFALADRNTCIIGIGNIGAVLPNIEDTGEPFYALCAWYITNVNAKQSIIYSTDTQATISISEVEMTENVHGIDPKFLPKGGFGYVSEPKTIDIEWIIKGEEDGDRTSWYTYQTISLVPGNTYTVTTDSGTYSTTCKLVTEEGIQAYALGNIGFVFGDESLMTDDSFVFMSSQSVGMTIGMDFNKGSTFIISEGSGKVHKIDPKFLPDGGVGYEERNSITVSQEWISMPFEELIGLEVENIIPGLLVLSNPTYTPETGGLLLARDDSSYPLTISYEDCGGMLSSSCLLFYAAEFTEMCPTFFKDLDKYQALAYAFDEVNDTMGMGITLAKGWHAVNTNTFANEPFNLNEHKVWFRQELIDLYATDETAKAYLSTVFNSRETHSFIITEENISTKEIEGDPFTVVSDGPFECFVMFASPEVRMVRREIDGTSIITEITAKKINPKFLPDGGFGYTEKKSFTYDGTVDGYTFVEIYGVPFVKLSDDPIDLNEVTNITASFHPVFAAQIGFDKIELTPKAWEVLTESYVQTIVTTSEYDEIPCMISLAAEYGGASSGLYAYAMWDETVTEAGCVMWLAYAEYGEIIHGIDPKYIPEEAYPKIIDLDSYGLGSVILGLVTTGGGIVTLPNMEQFWKDINTNQELRLELNYMEYRFKIDQCVRMNTNLSGSTVQLSFSLMFVQLDGTTVSASVAIAYTGDNAAMLAVSVGNSGSGSGGEYLKVIDLDSYLFDDSTVTRSMAEVILGLFGNGGGAYTIENMAQFWDDLLTDKELRIEMNYGNMRFIIDQCVRLKASLVDGSGEIFGVIIGQLSWNFMVADTNGNSFIVSVAIARTGEANALISVKVA